MSAYWTFSTTIPKAWEFSKPGSRGGGGFPDLAHLAVGRPVAVNPVDRLRERVEPHFQGLQFVACAWKEIVSQRIEDKLGDFSLGDSNPRQLHRNL